jgi:CheY-like chemotaxis protein
VLSHELRTPLTPVLLIVSLLEAQSELPQDVREELCTIRRHVELEARLIDDLLDLTRVTRGNLQLNFETADVHELIRRSLEISQREEKTLDTRLELEAKQHFVRADPARLQQVFWSLINNAVKFTPAGGKLLIRTSNGADGRIKVEFTDNGIGIDPGVFPKLFKPFQQGDGSLTRKFGGLGLGLAIAKNLVDAHGGSIAAFSAGNGQGATFAVELSTVADSQPKAAPSHIGRLGPVRKRILLVEDHEGTLKVMMRLLTQLGHHVTPVSSVREALGAMDRQEFDLLVSDIGLPDGSGHDIMEAMQSRSMSKGAGVHGIAISGFGMEEDVSRSKEVGFEQHLTKPIDLAKLEAAVKRAAVMPA